VGKREWLEGGALSGEVCYEAFMVEQHDLGS